MKCESTVVISLSIQDLHIHELNYNFLFNLKRSLYFEYVIESKIIWLKKSKSFIWCIEIYNCEGISNGNIKIWLWVELTVIQLQNLRKYRDINQCEKIKEKEICLTKLFKLIIIIWDNCAFNTIYIGMQIPCIS